MGTSCIVPADGEKALTEQVLPVRSKMAHCLPTTIIFACESNSEVEDSWKRSEVALAIKDASREAYGLRPRRLNLP